MNQSESLISVLALHKALTTAFFGLKGHYKQTAKKYLENAINQNRLCIKAIESLFSERENEAYEDEAAYLLQALQYAMKAENKSRYLAYLSAMDSGEIIEVDTATMDQIKKL